MIDHADIRDRAAGQAEAIARDLLGAPNRKLSNRREMRWGRHGSLKLDLSTGRWVDWEAGAHGDMADLVIRELGGDQSDAFRWLCRWLGVDPGRDDEGDEAALAARRAKRKEEADRHAADSAHVEAAKREEAAQFWDEAQPLLNSPAEFYLSHHRLSGRDIPHPAVRSARLRFHPAPYSRVLHEPPVTDEISRPAIGAMLAFMVDPLTGAFVGIQRTFLDRDCRKIWRKMLGGSGVVQLAHSRPGRLGLCEGIEDGLLLLAEGWPGSMSAAMNAGNMGAFPVLPDVPALTIFPDRDTEKNGRRAGQDAAHACWQSWKEAGRDVNVWWPHDRAKDFGELLREQRNG